jgi:hypothetical protein
VDSLDETVAKEADNDLKKIMLLPPEISQPSARDVQVANPREHVHQSMAGRPGI